MRYVGHRKAAKAPKAATPAKLKVEKVAAAPKVKVVKVRAKRAKRKDPAAVALGRKGGKARLTTMTASQRSELARAAVKARWDRHKQEAAAEKPEVSSC